MLDIVAQSVYLTGGAFYYGQTLFPSGISDSIQNELSKNFIKGNTVHIQDHRQGNILLFGGKGGVAVGVDKEVTAGLIKTYIELGVIGHLGNIKSFLHIFD